MAARDTRASILAPLGLAPAALDRVEASAYCGFGPTHFDKLVTDGRMPRPRRADGRLIWLRHELDKALLALPVDDGRNAPPASADPWADPRV